MRRLLRDWWHPHSNPKQAQAEGARPSDVWRPSFLLCFTECALPRTFRTATPQVEPCDDTLTHCFCPCCAVAQEFRELKKRYGSGSPESSQMER